MRGLPGAASSSDPDQATADDGPDAAALFRAAIEHHRGERPHLAEPLYRRLIDIEPDHADVLDLLGVLVHQDGRHAEAIGLIEEAIRRRPDKAAYYSDLGSVQQHLGDFAAAVANFDRAI